MFSAAMIGDLQCQLDTGGAKGVTHNRRRAKAPILVFLETSERVNNFPLLGLPPDLLGQDIIYFVVT